MNPLRLTYGDLNAQLKDLGTRFHQLSEDEKFIVWFLRAYLTDSEQQAVDALSGGSRDKGIDAILIDDAAKAVFIVQAKYRAKLAGTAEKRQDVIAFAHLAVEIADPDTAAFKQFLQGASATAAMALRRTRSKVVTHGYRCLLYFVTSGNVSSSTERDARSAMRTAKCDASLEVLAGRRLLVLLSDYLDGVAPPIPMLDLEMEAGQGIKVNGVLQRYDTVNELESWAFSMRGSAVAELFERGGVRLFARNVRGFLGDDTPVNRGMARTLSAEPDRFFYYNNGITVVCDQASKVSSKGRDVLRVSNPQVINGQQTSRMLAQEESGAAKASVLVKVIRVPRDRHRGTDQFDDLISRIVSGTNSQNAIKPSDLMSNDRRQIDLERSLRRLDYQYLRKRQSKQEMKALSGGKRYTAVRKEEMAQAVAGCDLDPVVARSGKDNLFNEDLYDQVFPNSDPDYYLPRYWLFRCVSYYSRGYPQRGYAKWLVLGFMWSELRPGVRTKTLARKFAEKVRDGDLSVVTPLGRAIDLTYRKALRYYAANRGHGASAFDISLFFRSKRGRDREFRTFWRKESVEVRRKHRELIARVHRSVAIRDDE
jgi:hypothetical protein